MVGNAIGSKLVQLEHEVMMGARSAENVNAAEWAQNMGNKACYGKFSEAAKFGEIVFNCVKGMYALNVLKDAGKDNLSGKILVDVTNPLETTKDNHIRLSICNTTSLGEKIQKFLPETKVVKALNTITSNLMVNPGMMPEDHSVFICGNDEKARHEVKEILKEWFGWKSVIDLGDITGARAMEMMMPMWLRLFQTQNNPNFNFKFVKGQEL
jgi:predicted dinucleotide-binding enzyme